MERIPVTVIVPVKNEEKNLGKCLALLSDFIRVIVVDSQSNDQTVQIATEFGAEVIQFYWNGKFPKKRNWVLRNIVIDTEWVLFIDADEYVSTDFISEVRQKTKKTDVNGYWLTYQNYFMGKLLKHGYPLNKLALFRLGQGEYEFITEDSWSHLDMEVHEHPIISGPVSRIKSPIIHNDFKGLEHYIARHNAYSSWEAMRFLNMQKDNFKKLTINQKTKYHLLHSGILPVVYFLGAYILKLGFLDGLPGYYIARYKANYFFQIQTKIKEIKQATERTR